MGKPPKPDEGYLNLMRKLKILEILKTLSPQAAMNTFIFNKEMDYENIKNQ